jgi:DNA-binding FadR family transcriptional regulator
MAKTPSRSAQLARDLLGRIARRELRPGDPIDVQALGRRHGVSRTVVREALADLGGKGLVVARPKVGTTVAPEADWNLLDAGLVAVAIAEPGPESMLAEATDLRRLIEPALATEAARDAGRPRQQAILQAVRTLADAVGTADAEAFRTAAMAVHAAVAAACGNRLLRSIDHAIVPVRALHFDRLAAAQLGGPAPGPDVLRMLSLQTALGLAIARREPSVAAAHAHALASIALVAASPARGATPLPFPDAPALRGVPTFLAPDGAPPNGDTTVGDTIIGDAIAAAASAGTPSPSPSPLPEPEPPALAATDPRLFAPDAPAPDPLQSPSVAPGPAGPPSRVEVDVADDWPPTETLVHDTAPLSPLRRATLDPDDATPPFSVPALLGDTAPDPSRRATLR